MRSKFDYIGGHPLIDLVNTEVLRQGKELDLFLDYSDVVLWLRDIGLAISSADIPVLGDDSLTKIQEFRRTMRDMLVAITIKGRIKYENTMLKLAIKMSIAMSCCFIAPLPSRS